MRVQSRTGRGRLHVCVSTRSEQMGTRQGREGLGARPSSSEKSRLTRHRVPWAGWLSRRCWLPWSQQLRGPQEVQLVWFWPESPSTYRHHLVPVLSHALSSVALSAVLCCSSSGKGSSPSALSYFYPHPGPVFTDALTPEGLLPHAGCAGAEGLHPGPNSRAWATGRWRHSEARSSVIWVSLPGPRLS